MHFLKISMLNGTIFIILLISLGVSSNAQNIIRFKSGKAGYQQPGKRTTTAYGTITLDAINSGPFDIYSETDILPEIKIEHDKQSYIYSDKAILKISFPFLWGIKHFYATAYGPSNMLEEKKYDENTPVFVNWLNQKTYKRDTWLYNNCKYLTTEDTMYSCVNCQKDGGYCSTSTGNELDCSIDIVGGAKNVSKRNLFYNVNKLLGLADVAMFCSGTISINGKEMGEITEETMNFPLDLPSSPGTFEAKISLSYSCLLAAKDSIKMKDINDGQIVHKCHKTTLYDGYSDNLTKVDILQVTSKQ